jgi:hypothetical protein
MKMKIKRNAESDLLFYTGKRLVVRKADTQEAARKAVEKAMALGHPHIRLDHGGDVANAYKHPASTEAVLTVASPDGKVVQWGGRVAANKVTFGGAADECLPGARALFDGRFSKAKRVAARAMILEQAELID